MSAVPGGRAGLSTRSREIDGSEARARISGVLDASPAGALLVGARGMAQALASVMGFGSTMAFPSLPHPVCIVVGSTDPISLAQVAAPESACAEMDHVPGPSGMLPAPAGPGGSITMLQATAGDKSRTDRVAASFARTALPYLQDVKSILLSGGQRRRRYSTRWRSTFCVSPARRRPEWRIVSRAPA